MKVVPALLFALWALPANAQRLSLTDLIHVTDNRQDTAAVFRYIRARGFNRRARTDDGNIVFLGDRDPGAKRFTEMIFIDLGGSEVKMVQYATRSTDNYAAIRRQVAEDGSFNALPGNNEGSGEVLETYSSREYLLHMETIGKATRYVISIRPKPNAKRRGS
ncbi:MAG: hypothetical protein EOO16_17145 [Chitinophagaceae bacterium]|nr:MAG: hypothetical protein EOO16_17145 [Chitinophagaceae bacterium]